ncbi:MAG: VOC family protein, partial [Ardenticatenaceae bacterium]
MPKVSGLGHVGIFVNDLMKQRDFYSRVMGLQITDEDLEQRGMVFMSAQPEVEHHEFVIMKGRTGAP